MRVYIAWQLLVALIAASLLAVVLYQRSWIPGYAEAEPLYPTVAEFGSELASLNRRDSLEPSAIRLLLLESRFDAIQPYGIVYSDDSEILLTIRINNRYSFDISPDGRPLWNKK